MQVVVTGATSFIGAATVKKLMEAGHRVFAVVRPASSNMKHLETMAAGNTPGALASVRWIWQRSGRFTAFWRMPGSILAGMAQAATTAQSGMCSSATSPMPWMRWRQRQRLAATAFYLPVLRQNTESGTGQWRRIRPVIRCLNMARQRWIFAKKQKYFANRRIWSIFIRGYTVCTVRGPSLVSGAVLPAHLAGWWQHEAWGVYTELEFSLYR